MKKIRLPSELIYALGIVIISFAVAMVTCADFGVSMIVAPAYIVSCKIEPLTFGQSEYIIQGLLFIVFCILMKKVKLVYFSSFATGLIYGALLDLWRLIIPHFNPEITPPGSLPMALRIVYFAAGMLLTSLAVSLFFRTYLYPQVYDFFVKGVSGRFGIDRTKFKIGFDISMLCVSVLLTLILFRKFVGIGVGTIIMTCCNGMLIGFFGRVFDRFFVPEPLAKKFSRYFVLDEKVNCG